MISLKWLVAALLISIALIGCTWLPRGVDAKSYPELGFTILDGNDKHCLTCGKHIPQKHNGNITWHASGEYLVFTAQNEDAEGDLLDSVAIPGVGLNCNLWAMSVDGEQVWRLTDLPTYQQTPQGVLHPQFSHDGEQLFWSQALGEYSPVCGEEWGKWQLAVADFVVENDAPRLENICYFRPGSKPRFHESHGWSLDDTSVIFSGNPEDGYHPPNGLDIYMLDIRRAKPPA